MVSDFLGFSRCILCTNLDTWMMKMCSFFEFFFNRKLKNEMLCKLETKAFFTTTKAKKEE